MLELKEITKIYEIGKPKDKDYQQVRALDGVSIMFRKSEFVSILGPSGCGKTTMLNIIGGLDKYTSGNLVINGISTNEYSDKDWDNYRNNRIGFVFQSYNLIPHLTVLENVELALTLSGVKKAERKEKAKQALIKVGLQDKINSKPNQLSGGQMQRVAIARALVNDPEIILADEPTGALDTKTSFQVMELLEEVAKERLVIMVTHNPDIANEYSTRIIKMVDGKLISDSNPITTNEAQEIAEELNNIKFAEEQEKKQLDALTKKERRQYLKNVKKLNKKRKKKMSFFTALTLSFKNLLTKKARTMLVSFAGSIGIIGIALILSLSSGFQAYIDNVQKDTLSRYPVTINKTSTDYTKLLESMQGDEADKEYKEDKIYSNNMLSDMLQVLQSGTTSNDLKRFKQYIDSAEVQAKLKDKATVKYTYNLNLNIFTEEAVGIDSSNALLVSPFSMLTSMSGNASAMSLMNDTFEEMLDNTDLLQSQYSLVDGKWAQTDVYNNGTDNIAEVVVVLDSNNCIPDYALVALGLRDRKDIDKLLNPNNTEEVGADFEISVSDLIGKEYNLVLNPDMYEYDTTSGLYKSIVKNGSFNPFYSLETAPKTKVQDLTSVKLKVVGIVKPNKDATATSISGTVGYTKGLTEFVVNKLEGYANATTNNALKEQLKPENANKSVLTGKYFTFTAADMYNYYVVENPDEYLALDTADQQVLIEYKAALDLYNNAQDAQKQLYKVNLNNKAKNVEDTFGENLAHLIDGSTLEQTLKKLGDCDLENPASISFYATDFEAKEDIEAIITDYNNMVMADETLGTLEDRQKHVITYTDYVGLMMQGITVIINAITYVLIAFVSISLVVSSIMIGIITYISVLERTKEIGVLRSVGASKKDIKRVFTAESLIIGFAAGMLGILVTLLLNIPINLILQTLAGISGVAKLPFVGGTVLVVISMFLTFIAGLIPANIASKKDPVIALRTE